MPLILMISQINHYVLTLGGWTYLMLMIRKLATTWDRWRR